MTRRASRSRVDSARRARARRRGRRRQTTARDATIASESRPRPSRASTVMSERVDAHARATTTTGGADASGGGFSKKILGLKVRATPRNATARRR